MSELAVETRQLRKLYGEKTAVSSLSLSVPRGSIFGFLGPNGAGKSTSIKMLLGLVKPTSGEATLLGAPAGELAVRRQIGFLPEHFRFYEWLTPVELLQLHGRLSGMSSQQLRERVPRMLELVGLAPHRDKRIHDFSKGMMQRAGLAQAIIHDPQIVFLDEPTSGLDPMGRRMVRDVIRAQRERGATVFLNSHLLSEVEATCDSVAFLKDGEVVANCDLQTWNRDEVGVAAQVRGLSPETMAQLHQRGVSARLDGEQLSLTAASRDLLPEIMRCLVAGGTEVYSFMPLRTSLEELFLRVVGEDRGL
jgi:ABC-2 type transport system ATP-binding protein